MYGIPYSHQVMVWGVLLGHAVVMGLLFLPLFRSSTVLGSWYAWRISHSMYPPGTWDKKLSDLMPDDVEWLSNVTLSGAAPGVGLLPYLNATVSSKTRLLMATPLDESGLKPKLQVDLGEQDMLIKELAGVSGAAVSYHMGQFDEAWLPIRLLQQMSFLSIGTTLLLGWRKTECSWNTFFWFGLPLGLCVPLGLAVPGLWHSRLFYEVCDAIFVLLFLTYLVVASIPLSFLARWRSLVLGLPFVDGFFRLRPDSLQMMMPNWPERREDHPAVVHLSDGGHAENLGILPLLQRRVPIIFCSTLLMVPSYFASTHMPSL